MSKIQNRERLIRKMKAMPEAVKEAIREAQAKNAEEVVEMAKRLAPVDDGALRDSIRSYDASDETGVRRRIVAGDERAFYASFVEFGTSTGRPAQPFFFPAYRALRRRIMSRQTRAMRQAIKKIADQK